MTTATKLTNLEKLLTTAIINSRAMDFMGDDDPAEPKMMTFFDEIKWERDTESMADLLDDLQDKGLIELDYSFCDGTYEERGRETVFIVNRKNLQIWWRRSELEAAINA